MSTEKVILVTGAASGVGRATACHFAARGYRVALSYPAFDAEDARQTLGQFAESAGDHLLCQCDVSQDAEVRAMLQQVEDHYGRLDAVVNAAGYSDRIPFTDLEAMSEEKWDRILAINTKGPFFVIRAATPLLRRQEGAAIVNVSSVASMYGPGSCLAYVASKGALNAMTRALARGLAPIRVNAVCPGPIDSRWMRQWMSDDQLASYADDFPVPRLSTPEDIADSIGYLIHTTQMTTGQLLIIDGGGRAL